MAYGSVIPIKVFVSYSHDSQDHMDRVLGLADRLREYGVDANLDQYVDAPPEGWPRWMQRQIDQADFVLVVSTETYNRRFTGDEAPGKGLGATWEGAVVTQALFDASAANLKFVPVVFAPSDIPLIPAVLKGATYYDVSAPNGFENLYRRITKQPLTPVPPLGLVKDMPPRERKNVFEPLVTQEEPVRDVPVLVNLAHQALLPWDSEWGKTHRTNATKGLYALSGTGYKEITMTLSGYKMNKNQRELLTACETAAVHTFGWPIGVVLHGREDSPRPRTDSIVAEISTSDRDHYQYWALRNNGDYYLLKSLFEDGRIPNSVFFNTRIVRTTEAFLYCSRLYTCLGVPPEATVTVGVKYGGLKGRNLTAVGNRMMSRGRLSLEDEVQASVTCPLGEVQARLVDNVKQICSPLFMLFDFFELDDSIYTEIVTDYANGKVS